MKIFSENGIRANGNILPLSEFALFYDLKEKVPCKEKVEDIIRRAEAVLNEDIPSLPLSLYREYHINGNRSNFEASYFARRRMAILLTLAEWQEGKGRFTDKLADVVWAILEESTWILPAHLYVTPFCRKDGVPPFIGEETLQGVDLFSATTAATLAAAYYCAKDSLDKVSVTICKRIKHLISERITKPMLQCHFWWKGDFGKKVNNWGPWIISNVLFCCAVLESDMDIRESVVNISLNVLDNFVSGYKPDGGCDEGPSYWGAAGASLFDCLELLYDMSAGRINLYGSELIRNIGEYIFKMNIDGRNFVNFADCRPTLNPPYELILRYGEKCDSPFLQRFAKKIAPLCDFISNTDHVYRGLKNVFYSKIDGGECDMPLISFMPDLMVMTARENGDSQKGTFLAAKGGNNAESHNHNDIGNFIVYHDGKPVIIDTGVGIYTKQTFSPDRYKLWFMQSGYHNLPSFDGHDQLVGQSYAASLLSYSEEERKVVFDLTAAYWCDAGIKKYERSVELKGSKVIAIDSFEYSDKQDHVTVFHLMSATEPKLVENGKVALAGEMTLIYDKELEVKIEAFDPVGMASKSMWNTDTLYRIHLTARGCSGCYRFEII